MPQEVFPFADSARTIVTVTKYSGLVELVQETIITAVDDGTIGTVANVRFDVERLANVLRAARTADRFNAAVATCEEEMRRWIIEASDKEDMVLFGHARAALSLKQRLEEPPPNRGYRQDGYGGFTPIV
jgi:deferrochelatase/peroxidase EfeB